ncbi:MAG: hypothetical protein AB2728_09665 [Candidatus Thiodiazotropha sp.]
MRWVDRAERGRFRCCSRRWMRRYRSYDRRPRKHWISCNSKKNGRRLS